MNFIRLVFLIGGFEVFQNSTWVSANIGQMAEKLNVPHDLYNINTFHPNPRCIVMWPSSVGRPLFALGPSACSTHKD